VMAWIAPPGALVWTAGMSAAPPSRCRCHDRRLKHPERSLGSNFAYVAEVRALFGSAHRFGYKIPPGARMPQSLSLAEWQALLPGAGEHGVVDDLEDATKVEYDGLDRHGSSPSDERGSTPVTRVAESRNARQ
jgi:hypothetical protein